MKTCIHILHLEDDVYDAELVQNELRSAAIACRITRVQSREEFSRALEHDGYDVILADYSLPGYDGMSALRLAQDRSPDTPFIFVSGMLGEDAAIEALTRGATDYVLKQKLSRLAPAIARALEEAQNRRERWRAEAALRDNERLLTEIAANYPNSYVSIIEKDFTIGFTSGQEFKKQQLDPQRFIGLTLEELFGEHAPTVRQQYRKAFHGEETSFELCRSDQHHLHKVVPLYDQDGHVTRILSVVENISERKRAEEEIRRLNRDLERRVVERTAQLEAANKDLEAFAYSASHDLRAPLRHIIMFLGMLRKRIAAMLDEESQGDMDIITNEARHMDALIRDLLAFSRMGRAGMTMEPVALGSLVREVSQECQPDTEDRDIQWQIGDFPVVTGDRAMLRIVLVNLIENALKFTRSRARTAIEIGSRPGQHAEVVIFVRDNGIGFDMRHADRIFDVFQRLHRDDEFGGTGIGLATVRRIIRQHGGRTWAEGEVEQGATFYFSLPQDCHGA